MRLYSLTARQVLPLTLTEAWDFFSDPRNLQEITPWFVGAALVAFLIAALLSLLWFTRLP